jgi:hypothetical protein
MAHVQLWYMRRRYKSGYQWAAAEWAKRDVKWAHPTFTQFDRDGYARALITATMEPDYGGDPSSYQLGIQAFARQRGIK